MPQVAGMPSRGLYGKGRLYTPPWSWGSGYRFTPLLRANPGGGSITSKHGSGYPGPSPEGGRCHILFQADLQVRPPKSHSKTGTVL